ncbi:MAG: amidohydrolase family protein [Myxococcales bacterium]|nr:amidohydrolase family protein [Myxococcales bacterium]
MRKRTSALTPWALSGLILAACNGDDTVTSATEGTTDTTTDTSSTTSSDTTTTTGDTTTTTSSTSETTSPTTTTTTGETTTTSTTTTTTGDTDTDTDGTTTGGGMGDVDCGGEALMPPEEGLCEVAIPGTEGLLLRGTVLAPDGVYTNGQVLVVGEKIACVGCNCADDPQAADASWVDCANGVISPGLINTHDHLGFANNVPIGQGPDRYEHRHDWRKGQNGHVKLTTMGSANKRQIEAGELRFLLGGATSTIGGGAGRPGLPRNLDDVNDKEGLAIQTVDSDTFPLDDANGQQIENGCMGYGANPTTAMDIADLDSYLPHIGEGINQAAKNEFFCTSMGNTDVIAAQSGIVHAIAVDVADIVETVSEKAKIVWSPRSNVVLYGNTAPVTAMDNLGATIALGTDWVMTGSMNMLREMQCADYLNTNYYDGHFSDADIWRMATSNAALVLGADHAIGALKPGYLADIAIFDGSEHPNYRAIIDGEPSGVGLVLRGGTPLYGDALLMSDPVIAQADCEFLDVCGNGKKVCVQKEIVEAGLAEIQMSIANIYPLFFCGEPDDEPTCTPWRDEYPDGITAEDADGDGIVDADDNCPLVFNPVRDFEFVQADYDDDGIGDVCDVCPADPGEECVQPDPNDYDGDGVPNSDDNCVAVANQDQADDDDDGKGNACDDCPEPNPGAEVCPTPIQAIRDPDHPNHPSPGSAVKIVGAYVTAVRPDAGNARGFHIQNDSLEPFSGIFVFTGNTSPTVKVGNKVTISGTYEEYFNFSEITAPEVVIDDAGETLPFSPIPIADPATLATGGSMAESHESMLLAITDVAITKQNADANDYDEFEVTGNLRIDDTIYDNVVNSGLNNACPVGSQFTQIVGVLGYSFSNTKLWPRIKADINHVMCDPAP